jgi:nucleoside-diphosphate-sugar epimerase
VYGNTRGGVFEESMAVEPANDYAVSKVAMEYMAKLWMDKLPLFIVRPFNYTGVGQSPQFLVPKIVDHFRRRAPYIELGNTDVSRDFSDVRSVVAAYRRLIEICPAGEIFNICSGQATSLRQVIDLSEEITGHRLEVRVNPDFVRENEIKSLVGSPDKLRNCLGEQLSIPFCQTLEWMLSAP